jgi:hypothetical protein
VPLYATTVETSTMSSCSPSPSVTVGKAEFIVSSAATWFSVPSRSVVLFQAS